MTKKEIAAAIRDLKSQVGCDHVFEFMEVRREPLHLPDKWCLYVCKKCRAARRVEMWDMPAAERKALETLGVVEKEKE